MSETKEQEQLIEQIQRERDLEWVDAVMPGNRRSLLGRTYNTPEKYKELAAAQSDLEAEDREETQILRLRLRSKRQEVAEMRSRIRELLVTTDALQSQLTAAHARIAELEAEVHRYRELATHADRKNEQNTMRVDFLEGGRGLLLQTSNNFSEQEIAELFANTYRCWEHIERRVLDNPPPSDAEGR